MHLSTERCLGHAHVLPDASESDTRARRQAAGIVPLQLHNGGCITTTKVLERTYAGAPLEVQPLIPL